MLGRYEGEPGLLAVRGHPIGKIGWYYIPRKLGKGGQSGPFCGGAAKPQPEAGCVQEQGPSLGARISDGARSGRQSID